MHNAWRFLAPAGSRPSLMACHRSSTSSTPDRSPRTWRFWAGCRRRTAPTPAIRLAQRAGIPLRMAAKVDYADRSYFHHFVRPLLDHPLVEFIGEIGDAQKSEFLGNAMALLFPINWPEPFGLVMVEAMACGTPVIAWNSRFSLRGHRARSLWLHRQFGRRGHRGHRACRHARPARRFAPPSRNGSLLKPWRSDTSTPMRRAPASPVVPTRVSSQGLP